MVASDARGRDVAVGDGAAAFRSPERAAAAADAERGAGNSGVLAPFRHAAVGEEGEAATADHDVRFDLDGKGRSGGGRRRRRRRRPRRWREKEEGGGLRFFYRKVHVVFRNHNSVPPLAFSWTAGYNSLFSRGFLEKASSTRTGSRRIVGGRPGSQHCSTVASYSVSYSTTVRAGRSQASISGSFDIVSNVRASP